MSDAPHDESLSNLLHEQRRFPPTAAFAAQANATEATYGAAAADRLAFWDEQASLLQWDEPWSQTLDWSDAPFARWFVDGTLNVAVNCVDRHVDAGLGDRVAIQFEGEPGDTRTLTYADLQREVSQAANALIELGVKAGDRVAIYLPMIPEAAIAMLACARLGAPALGGVRRLLRRGAAQPNRRRPGQARDHRRRRIPPRQADAAQARRRRSAVATPTVRNVLVVRRTGQRCRVERCARRVVARHRRQQSTTHEAQSFDAEHPLFILYTSGTTGKPKGILHTTGGYLTQAAYTHNAVFDLKPETDVYWCTADVGWVTGHSYIVYGPLANGATQVIYEGTPDTPHQGRWWEIVEKYRVSILYTAPTAIRTFMKWGDDVPAQLD